MALAGIVVATFAGGIGAAAACGTERQLDVRRWISTAGVKEKDALDTVRRMTRRLVLIGVVVAASATVTSAAAARGTRRQSGGARLCRRTYLARRPQGAAVARTGVGRKWPNELLCEPAPRASGVLTLPTTIPGAGLEERTEGGLWIFVDGRHGGHQAAVSCAAA